MSMRAKSISIAFTTSKLAETRDFYVNYLGAKVIFDCDWYVNLKFGNKSSTLQFILPLQKENMSSSSEGLIYKFVVENVDEEYEKVTQAGLDITTPLEGHPWGDRGFTVQDPNGISLYIYSENEPSEEFKQSLK